VRAAVADELCGELVDALLDTHGGGEILADLERRNCFLIALDSRRQWYRCHRLFLELLRSRLAARPRREREELHSRAARWYAENDHPVEAIRHAISAQEWRFAADLAGERWLDVVLAGRGPALRPLLARLPDELIEREPAIAVACAAIHLEPGGQPERTDTYLDLARAALELAPADRRWPSFTPSSVCSAPVREVTSRSPSTRRTRSEACASPTTPTTLRSGVRSCS
jgi:LuxR family maltose regulon positive regulatory protein